MAICQTCGASLASDEALFCSECGARVTAGGAPAREAEAAAPVVDDLDQAETINRDESRAARKYEVAVSEALADGVLDRTDERALEATRDRLHMSLEEAKAARQQVIDNLTTEGSAGRAGESLPVTLEINDNHFYMEGCLGVLDLRVTNHLDASVAEAAITVEGSYLGRHEYDLWLPARGSAGAKIQVAPSVAGEHLLDLAVRVVVDGRVRVFSAQPTLMVLKEDENPSNVTMVFDQRMDAGKNIGYGLSIRNEVKEGFAQGMLRNTNDLMRQSFDDSWHTIALRHDRRRTDEALQGRYTQVIRVSAPAVADATDRAAVLLPDRAGVRRVLLLGTDRVTFGRRREGNDVILRLWPRGEDADTLTRQISSRHVDLALNDEGAAVTDLDTANGTTLDGQPVRGGAAVPVDRPSDLAVARALRLRLIPFTAAATHDPVEIDVFDQLGRADPLWRTARQWSLRSMVVQRCDNAGDEEKYVAVYRWIEIGHGPGNEIILPQACRGRKCMRLIRRDGCFWLESRCQDEALRAGDRHLACGHACPLTEGMIFGCDKVRMQFAPFEQVGL